MNLELTEKIVHARAIRDFDKTRPISEADWQSLLQVAQAAPSSNGLEPWKIIQVDSPEIREAIQPFAPGMSRQLASAPKFVFFVSVSADKDSAQAHHIKEDISGYDAATFRKWQEKFEALHTQLLTIDFVAWQERQSALPAGQMLLAANLMGIDCCPMEGFDYEKVTEILAQKSALDPTTERLGIALAFGYRKEDPSAAKIRRPLSEIVRQL